MQEYFNNDISFISNTKPCYLRVRHVRMAMGKGLELSVSQPSKLGLNLGKKERRCTSMKGITIGSSGCGGSLNAEHFTYSKVKVPGKTSGRYLLLEFDPKDRQVDPAGCQSLPLLPHVWKIWDSDQVSKIPPDFRLWQWRILESSSHLLTWSSKCQHSRGTGFGTWDLTRVPKE